MKLSGERLKQDKEGKVKPEIRERRNESKQDKDGRNRVENKVREMSVRLRKMSSVSVFSTRLLLHRRTFHKPLALSSSLNNSACSLATPPNQSHALIPMASVGRSASAVRERPCNPITPLNKPCDSAATPPEARLPRGSARPGRCRDDPSAPTDPRRAPASRTASSTPPRPRPGSPCDRAGRSNRRRAAPPRPRMPLRCGTTIWTALRRSR